MLLQLKELQTKHEQSLFRLDNIKDDNYQINLYTSFPDYDTLLYFYKKYFGVRCKSYASMEKW